jgi:hypothetical protein
LTCDQDDGRTIAIGLEYPVDEMQASGAATAGSATCACAANAPASSCLTETHSISLFSSERAIRLSVSPTTPMLDACILQGFNNDVRDQLAHGIQTLL